MTLLEAADMAPRERVFDALNYQAPFLIEKLVKDHIVETPQEAEALFTEVKRYLVIAALDREKSWHMYSLRIDECWHQFILFTRQYIDFCRTYFGRYVPHAPSNAPESKAAPSAQRTTFKEFNQRYEELFGMSIPEIWIDARHVTPRRRVLNDHVGRMTLRDDAGMIDLLNANGEIVLSVNDVAEAALTFIAQTGAFYVRELPGGLDDEEKVALVSMLVQSRILRLAS